MGKRGKVFIFVIFSFLLMNFSLISAELPNLLNGNSDLPRLINPNAFFGNFSWNGNCLDGGVEIRNDGTICGQRLEIFNITSVNITQQNLTILEDAYFNGRVGIGTTNPQELLHVGEGTDASDITATDLLVTRAGPSSLSVRDSTNNVETFVFSSSVGGIIGTVTNDPLNIKTNNINAIFIDASQNVGIGTSSPDSTFHIKASTPGTVGSHPAGQLIIQNPTDTVFSNAVITGYESDGSGNPDQQLWYLGSSSGSNSNIIFLNRRNALLQFGTSGTSRMTILGNGDVGIGIVSSLLAKLHVLGNVFFDGNLNVTGNITSANVFIPQYIFPHTNATIPLASANVWANITFDKEVTDIKFGISHTHNDNSNHTFTINIAGVYNLEYDFDVIDTSPSASDIDTAGRIIYTNGTEIPGSAFETDITKQQIETEISHSTLARLNAGDEIVFQFTADDVDVAISTHGTFGDHPDSATVIIQKIANI